MARRIYIGTGAARKVKTAYIGSGNVARKIVKGYVGVGNQAKQFWPIQYVWNRYEVDSITKYRDGLASRTSDLYDQITGGAWPYRPVLFNSYIFNTATGEYTGSGGYWTPDYESKSVSGYLIQPNYKRGHVTHIQFDQMWSSTGSTTYYLHIRDINSIRLNIKKIYKVHTLAKLNRKIVLLIQIMESLDHIGMCIREKDKILCSDFEIGDFIWLREFI